MEDGGATRTEVRQRRKEMPRWRCKRKMRRRSTRKRGGRTECSDYHENPWNPWHRGDGKRGRQIRTIAGVSRTALSVMVVVLLPSSSYSDLPPVCHPAVASAYPCSRPYSFPPSRLSRSLGFSRSFRARNIHTYPIASDLIYANFEIFVKYPVVHESSILTTSLLIFSQK